MEKSELKKIERLADVFRITYLYDENGKLDKETVKMLKDFNDNFKPSKNFLEAAEKFNELKIEWISIKQESLSDYIPHEEQIFYERPQLFYFELPMCLVDENDEYEPGIDTVIGETFDTKEERMSINVKDITCLSYEDIKYFEDNKMNVRLLKPEDMPVVENYIKELNKLEKILEKKINKSFKNIGD